MRAKGLPGVSGRAGARAQWLDSHPLTAGGPRGRVPYAELVQAGRLALWRAALHFDPQRGVQF
ncbi:MAG: hypothetical protein JXR84_16515, partial [Anaerolineae bacterium]|nr:hypothetical protein [Anaerolineae bacterium]